MSRQRPSVFWAMCLLCAFSLSAFAAERQPVLDAMHSDNTDFFRGSMDKLSGLAGFQCHFNQLIIYNDGGGQHYSGELAVRKPGAFRWQYVLPYEQLYIGNGEDIWHYEADLMQAERMSNLESVDPVVMQLLDGRVPFSDMRMLGRQHDEKMNLWRYQVQIGDAPAVWLGFSRYGDLSFIERQDVLGNSNRITLSTCSFIAPAANLFSFTPPEGVEVLDLR